jgi:2-haloacid dehalogenase
VLTEWFGTVLRLAFVATITGEYHDFSAIQGASLQMIAEREGVELSEDARSAVAEGVRRLPPHPEVAEGLSLLKRAGRRLITLTNSPPAVLEEQLTNAGLADFFEQRLSIDAVGRFKPAPEAYRHAADTLGVPVSDLLVVAAHDWDIAGAMRAGCEAAFVARPGKLLSPLQEKPRVIGPDLVAVAREIERLEEPATV